MSLNEIADIFEGLHLNLNNSRPQISIDLRASKNLPKQLYRTSWRLGQRSSPRYRQLIGGSAVDLFDTRPAPTSSILLCLIFASSRGGGIGA